ncbi:MAG: 50S ribosomal protein L17 [Flavobacteriaceae bacterium]
MRHGKKINHLGRKTAHRKSMLANMACSLIEHKRINTTVAKAKALKQFVEPLVTKSKEDTTHNRRIVYSRLRQKEAVAELFREVAVKVADRPGGYTRIIKLGNRLGDNADMAMIELVDFNEVYNANKPAKKKSTRRAGKGKKADDTTAKAAPAEKTEEVTPAEKPEATTPETTAPEATKEAPENNEQDPKNEKE